MADLDTRNKRASALGFARTTRIVFPDPDAVITGQADAQQMAYSYPGILVGASVGHFILNDLTTMWSERYQPVIHAAHSVGSAYDDTTMVHADQPTARPYALTDLNTAYALYIATIF